jgi:hypothetical protein
VFAFYLPQLHLQLYFVTNITLSTLDAKRLDEFDVEDILVQIMSDEFHTDLEDGSAYAVSRESGMCKRKLYLISDSTYLSHIFNRYQSIWFRCSTNVSTATIQKL